MTVAGTNPDHFTVDYRASELRLHSPADPGS
jgi:hypothetical protein